MRGRIEDGRCHFQVTLKVGFRLDAHPPDHRRARRAAG
jgi:hypothetical protein